MRARVQKSWVRWGRAGLVAVVLAGACGYSEPAPAPRRTMLVEVADVVIMPTYEDLVVATGKLAAAAQVLQSEPTMEALAATQSAWREARRPWKQSEAFRLALGPSESLQLRVRSKLDWTPINPDRVEDEIAGTAEFTPEYIDGLGTTRRGFGAVEYLLFDAEGGNEAVLAVLTGDDGQRRRDYVAALTQDMARLSETLVRAWDPTDGNFRGQLIEAGQNSETYDTLKKAVDELINSLVLLSAYVEDKDLGDPAGLRMSPEPRPELAPSARSDNGVADILDNLQSIENVYLCSYSGHTGASLSEIVREISPEVDDKIRLTLRQAQLTVSTIPAPYTDAVITDRDQVAKAYQRAREVRLILSLDLVSVLGATPVFIGDGD